MIINGSPTLESLFKDSKYTQASQMANGILEQQPGNVVARYCAGIADVMSGQLNKGLSQLWIIFQQYKNISVKPDHTTMLFIGRTAQQFSVLCESSTQQIIAKSAYSIAAANVMKEIGLEISDRALISHADKILSRVLKSDNNAGAETAMYLRPESPFILQVEPTNNCNLKCRMCPREHMKRTTGFLDEFLWRDILESWTYKTRMTSFKHLVHHTDINFMSRGDVKMFFMGEPMLHPKLDVLISMANDAGCQVALQTNGALMNNDKLRRKLLNAGPACIAISLDGVDISSYESVREGSLWSKIVSGLESLHRERAALKLSHVQIQVSTIITEDKEDNRKQALNFLEPIRKLVDDVVFIALTRSYNPEFVDLQGNISTYGKVTASASLDNSPDCLEPLNKVNVLWDGTITPCCHDIDGQIVLGHAKDGIDNVWNNDKTYALHKALLSKKMEGFPLCISCLG